MKIVTRTILIGAIALVSCVAPLCAQQRQQRIIATTTWTAAYAAAAGVDDILTLAPTDLRHPAEYELKPSDVAALRGADLIIYTGFEVMAKKLAEAAGNQDIKMLQIDADYSLPTMRASIMAIADLLGTAPKARESIAALDSFLASWKAELRTSGLLGAPVLAHVFQVPLMKELGFTVKGVFGPGPLEATQIAKLSSLPVSLIVDNWHNEAAAPLRETMRSVHYLSLINFPGPDGTVTLLAVLADNRKRLETAVGQ